MTISAVAGGAVSAGSRPAYPGSELQGVLDQLNDVALTLKHAHWNVTGPSFVAVHTMLGPQAAQVGDMVDTVAERMAAMGGSPDGRADGIVRRRHGGSDERAAQTLSHTWLPWMPSTAGGSTPVRQWPSRPSTTRPPAIC